MPGPDVACHSRTINALVFVSCSLAIQDAPTTDAGCRGMGHSTPEGEASEGATFEASAVGTEELHSVGSTVHTSERTGDSSALAPDQPPLDVADNSAGLETPAQPAAEKSDGSVAQGGGIAVHTSGEHASLLAAQTEAERAVEAAGRRDCVDGKAPSPTNSDSSEGLNDSNIEQERPDVTHAEGTLHHQAAAAHGALALGVQPAPLGAAQADAAEHGDSATPASHPMSLNAAPAEAVREADGSVSAPEQRGEPACPHSHPVSEPASPTTPAPPRNDDPASADMPAPVQAAPDTLPAATAAAPSAATSAGSASTARRAATARCCGVYVVRPPGGRGVARVVRAAEMQASVDRLYAGASGAPDKIDACAPRPVELRWA
jgi:hypothetical protein